MKKIFLLSILTLATMACTNAKLVQYNSDRIANMEGYLKDNQFVEKNENLENLKKRGEVEESKVYKSIEREADAWEEEK